MTGTEKYTALQKVLQASANERQAQKAKQRRPLKRPRIRPVSERKLDKYRPPPIQTNITDHETRFQYAQAKRQALSSQKRVRTWKNRHEARLVYNLKATLYYEHEKRKHFQDVEEAKKKRGVGGIYFPDHIQYEPRSSKRPKVEIKENSFDTDRCNQ